jgi:hypothetical protein
MRETVTEKEKAVLDAMRMGASVQLIYTTDQISEVDGYLDCFDSLKPNRAYIHDRTGFVYPYVGFVKHYDDIELTVQATIMLEGSGKNE